MELTLEIRGEGQGTYFGATRFQFNNGTITEPEASNIYFNGFLILATWFRSCS